jgi:hypothetical protein
MRVPAHQYLLQLPRPLHDAIIANCGNYAVFRIGAQNVDVMAAELGIQNARTLWATRATSRPRRSSCSTAIPTDAFLVQTDGPKPPAEGRAGAVIAYTRAQHTRERADVERMIVRQLGDS